LDAYQLAKPDSLSNLTKTLNVKNLLKKDKAGKGDFGSPTIKAKPDDPTPPTPSKSGQIFEKQPDPFGIAQQEKVIQQIVKEERKIVGYDVSGQPVYSATVRGAVSGTITAQGSGVMQIPSQPEIMVFPTPTTQEDQGITGALFDITSGLGELPTVMSEVDTGLKNIKPTAAIIPTTSQELGQGQTQDFSIMPVIDTGLKEVSILNEKLNQSEKVITEQSTAQAQATGFKQGFKQAYKPKMSVRRPPTIRPPVRRTLIPVPPIWDCPQNLLCFTWWFSLFVRTTSMSLSLIPIWQPTWWDWN
jgi:hypothetical protein